MCPPRASVALDARPAVTEILPPIVLSAVVSPALRTTSPPAPVVPEPTVVKIDPPLPLVAEPVRNEIKPLSPLLVVPVINDRKPLTPLVPAFEVFKNIDPLDLVVPTPDVNETWPPDKSVLFPDVITK